MKFIPHKISLIIVSNSIIFVQYSKFNFSLIIFAAHIFKSLFYLLKMNNYFFVFDISYKC